MRPECFCAACGWMGDWSELENDFVEDSDGDLVGSVDACPSCGGATEDTDHVF